MKKIWKFSFETTDFFTLDMPIGAEILNVDLQYNNPCMWAMCDPDAEKETRRFCVYGTSHPVYHPTDKKYIGTYQLMGGSLVLHLFEEINKPNIAV